MAAMEFRPDWQREFDQSPYSLRFELSDTSQHPNNFVTRFIASFDRARALARAAMPSGKMMAVIAANPGPENDINAEPQGWVKGVSAFDHLTQLGVETNGALATFDDYFWPYGRDDPEEDPWEHRVISITWREADLLLWNQIATDMGVGPIAPVQSKLIDSVNCMLVHAYDDRGMDIISLEASPTQSLYETRNEWLLDYDRPRMAEVYES